MSFALANSCLYDCSKKKKKFYLQMLAFECIPALNAQFREHVDGC